MNKRFTVAEYLRLPEQMAPQELVWGMVREPPAPKYGHQATVGRVFVALDEHVRTLDLGVVCVSPLDVVLDEARGLVVQPDVLFVSRARLHIIKDQIWGAPDLVVEVASRRTILRDRTTKLSWYGRAGVRECWIVDPARETVAVIALPQRGRKAFPTFKEREPLRSTVLPGLDLPAGACFS
jgi:Uma2 family endonuclease